MTADAAQQYARACGIRPEEARRVLTQALLGREIRPGVHDLLQVRSKSRTTQLDVYASLVWEPPLLLVVRVSVRPYL